MWWAPRGSNSHPEGLVPKTSASASFRQRPTKLEVAVRIELTITGFAILPLSDWVDDQEKLNG